MADFHLIRPYWLLALIPTFILIFFLFKRKENYGAWEKYCDKNLLSHIIIEPIVTKMHKFYLIGLSFLWVFTIIILSGPSFSKVEQPIFHPSYSRILVVDLSNHMLVDDVKPSRLEIAKLKIKEILKEGEGIRNGLVLFAEQGFQVIPVTHDTETISVLLKSLKPDIMPENGYKPELGVEKAIQLLNQSNTKDGEIVLITTGDIENHNSKITSLMKKVDYSLSIIGVGTVEGAPNRTIENEFIYKDNNVELSKLNENAFYKLKNKTGGKYITVQSALTDISDISKIPYKLDIDNSTSDSLTMTFWNDYGAFLVMIILPFLAMSFRKGLIIPIIFFALIPHETHASFDDLWLTKNQQAKKMYDSKKYDAAAEIYENKKWQAMSHYKAGDYEKAAEIFEAENELFNAGTSYAKARNYKKALVALNKILEQEPNNNKAIQNKKIILELMEKDKKPPCECDNKKESDEKSDSNENNSNDKSNSQAENKNEPEKQEDNSSQEEQNNNHAENNLEDNQEKQSESKNEEQQAQDEQSNQPKDNNEQITENDTQNLNSEIKEDSLDLDSKEILAEQNNDDYKQDEKILLGIPDDPGRLLKAKLYKQYLTERN